MSFIKKEDINNKKVISSDGNVFGTVKDLAFSMDGSLGLVIEKKEGGEEIIPIQKVLGVGEFVVLTPETGPAKPFTTPTALGTPSAAGSICPSCGNVNKTGAKFCAKCGTKLP